MTGNIDDYVQELIVQSDIQIVLELDLELFDCNMCLIHRESVRKGGKRGEKEHGTALIDVFLIIMNMSVLSPNIKTGSIHTHNIT